MGRRPNPNSTKSRRLHPWKDDYAKDYGVRPIEREEGTNEVLVAECCFCAVFGREERAMKQTLTIDKDGNEVVKKSRQRTRNVATWKRPFRTDNMRSHHCEQHPTKWKEYQELRESIKQEAQKLQISLAHEFPPMKDATNGTTALTAPTISNALASDLDRLTQFFGKDLVAREGERLSTALPFVNRPVKRMKVTHTSRPKTSGSTLAVDPTNRDLHLPTSVVGGPIAVRPLQIHEITNLAILKDIIDKMELFLPLQSTIHNQENDGGVKQMMDNKFPSKSPNPYLLPIYTPSVLGTEATQENQEMIEKLMLHVPNLYEMHTVHQLLPAGLSFTQITEVMKVIAPTFHHMEQNQLNELDGITTEERILKYAIIAIAANLQMLAHLMISVWTYAVVLGITIDPISKQPALEISIRLPTSGGGKVQTFHVVTCFVGPPAAPNTKKSTLAIVDFITTILNALDSVWTTKCIGFVPQGSVTARANFDLESEIMSTLNSHLISPYYNVWNPVFKLESYWMHAIMKIVDPKPEKRALSNGESGNKKVDLSSGCFIAQMIELSNFLRSQQEWISQHGICPVYMQDDDISSLFEILKWVTLRHDDVKIALSECNQAPQIGAWWWLVSFVIADLVASSFSITHSPLKLNSLSRASTARVFEQSVQDLCSRCNIQRSPNEDPNRKELVNKKDGLKLGQFHWRQMDLENFFRSLNLSTRRIYDELNADQKNKTGYIVARLLLCGMQSMVQEMHTVVKESNNKIENTSPGSTSEINKAVSTTNESLDKASTSLFDPPPTKPLEFVAMKNEVVGDVIEMHSRRLETLYSVSSINTISQDMWNLRHAISADDDLNAKLQQCSTEAFEVAWAPLGDKFQSLRVFAAGLATVNVVYDANVNKSKLPCTARRELVNRSKYSNQSLSSQVIVDFSIESQQHGKQLETLSDAYLQSKHTDGICIAPNQTTMFV